MTRQKHVSNWKVWLMQTVLLESCQNRVNSTRSLDDLVWMQISAVTGKVTILLEFYDPGVWKGRPATVRSSRFSSAIAGLLTNI